jgi:hypothetical protein
MDTANDQNPHAAALTPASFFGAGGSVARAIKNFEPRKQQERMASAVYKAVTDRKHSAAPTVCRGVAS